MFSLFIENKKLENDNIYADDISTYASTGFLLHYKHTKTHKDWRKCKNYINLNFIFIR